MALDTRNADVTSYVLPLTAHRELRMLALAQVAIAMVFGRCPPGTPFGVLRGRYLTASGVK